MIKRRFYKGGDSSDSSSSSDSDSDSLPETEEEEEYGEQKAKEEPVEEQDAEKKHEEDDDEVAIEMDKSEKRKKRKKRNKRSPSPCLLASEEDGIDKGGENLKDDWFIKNAVTQETHKGASKSVDGTLNSDDSIQSEFADCILQCKSVFKCRLCPRIVCLSEDTVKVHLKSKRHARSKKLLGEGRLKLMLNSDGEIEEDLETHAERHMRTVALAQEPVVPVKKDSGRQRQSRRRKKKQLRNSSCKGNTEESAKNPQKKPRKNEV